jgi:FtsH-binding integral membrane protein
MPVLIFIVLIVILYIMVIESREMQNRPTLSWRLAIAGLIGLVLSFAILAYLVATYRQMEDAYPGCDNVVRASGTTDCVIETT